MQIGGGCEVAAGLQEQQIGGAEGAGVAQVLQPPFSLPSLYQLRAAGMALVLCA